MASVIPGKHIEYALELIVSSEVEEEKIAQLARERLAQWRIKKPEHELAYHEALRQWQLLGNIAPELKEQFKEPAINAGVNNHEADCTQSVRPNAIKRPGIFSAIALFICTAALSKAAIWYWHQPVFEQAIHTDVAQVIQVTLPDGTHLDVNAHSDLRVTLYRQKREIELNSGEARFAVSHNADVPFNVRTREGDVNVIGTVFTVADRGRSVNVTVEEGHVRFQSRLASNAAAGKTDADANQPVPVLVDLYAGEYLAVSNGQPGAKTRIDTADAAAWRDGWLVFNNTPLEDAIPQINAFRQSPILLGSYKTSQLRLTGRFMANDSRQLDKALPKILPVQVKRSPNGTTLVTAR